MKDVTLNPLDKNQRKLLQLGVILMLGIFLLCYFFFISSKNKTVYLQNNNLHIFDETMKFTYPDQLHIHNGYLILAKPEQNISYIYSLATRSKEKDVKERVLDYYKGKVLYNKGAETFADNKNLGILCERGVFQTDQEVLCVVKVSPTTIYSKVISINLDTKLQKDVYVSNYIISDITTIDGNYYVGGIDPTTNKSYLVVDGKQIAVPNIVNIIYPLEGKPYFASFKGALNPNQESYYELTNTRAILQKDDNVVLYK